MDLFTTEWFLLLLNILIIDLVLAGDNAIVIGLAARNVPKDHQKVVIGLGTVGAIIIRIIATLVVVRLLMIPGLHVIGGVLLIWIAYKLLVGNKEHQVTAKNTVIKAIGTIIMADAAMGLDNVLAVAGAASGDYVLVIVGLIVSIPIVVWGSLMILRLTQRFPWIIMIGAAVLAYTAANMITNEPLFGSFFDNPFLKWGMILIVIIGLLFAGKRKQLSDTVLNVPSA